MFFTLDLKKTVKISFESSGSRGEGFITTQGSEIISFIPVQ